MKNPTLFKQILGMGLMLVLLVGCGAPAMQEPTLVPPTSSPTIVATSTQASLAEPITALAPGTWTDDFNGVLTPGWSWVDEDWTRWNLKDAPGALRIITQGESLYGANKSKNLLLRDAPAGDFEITTKVAFDPQNNFQGAGILIYQDEDNFALITRAFCNICLGSGSGIFLDNEMNGKLDVDSGSRIAVSLQTTWLKLQKEGTTYTGFYSADGENWDELGRVENPMSPTKVGLTANNSQVDPNVPQIPADYDFFTVESITLATGSVETTATNLPSAALPTLNPDQLVAIIPVGSLPFRLAIGEGAIWVTDQRDSAVYRIDPQTNQVVATIAVGRIPKGLLVSEGAVWVANTGGTTVSRIDVQTNQEVATIEVGEDPRNLAAGAGAIWVTSGTSEGIVSRIDPSTNQIVATINVEANPSQIAVANDAVWVASIGSHFISRIDSQTNQVVARIDVGQSTIALAADQGAVWAGGDDPTLIRIDPETNQVAARIPVGSNSWGIASDMDAIWVTSNENDALWRIDPRTNEVVSTYKVGDGPLGVAVGVNALWVVNSFDHTIWRIIP